MTGSRVADSPVVLLIERLDAGGRVGVAGCVAVER